MLSFLKIKILIAFVFCYLLQNILTHYISFKMVEVDDCVRYVNFTRNGESKIVVNFTGQNTGCDTVTYDPWGPCKDNEWDSYAKDGYLLKDYEYDAMNEIAITFEDWEHENGFMAIDVEFDEYIIRYQDQSFWECINCLNTTEGETYIYGDQDIYRVIDDQGHKDKFTVPVFKFHASKWLKECGVVYYTFYFRIDDINDLYKGGKNGQPFEIKTDYYDIPNEQLKIKLNITEEEGEEGFELINFIKQEIIHGKQNSSLVFQNTDFKYLIGETHKEGQLKGLSPNNIEDNDINWGDYIICTETSGLNYTLGPDEIHKNYTEVRIKITVFKNCPENTDIYKYCNSSSAIIEEKEFIFEITINHPPDTTEPTTTTPDTTQPTTTTPSTQGTTTTPDTTQPTTTTPSTHGTTTTPSTQGTTTTPDSTQGTTTTPSTQGTTTTPDSTQEATTTSNNIEQKDTSSTSDSSINQEIFDCLDNYTSHDVKNDVYSHVCINFTKNDILDNLQEVVKRIDENKTYKIIGKDFIAQVVPIDYLDENNTNNNNEIFSSSSHTNFTDCEIILRRHYNIYSPKKLTFIQVELNNTNDDILVNQIEYQVYDDNQTLLNLSLCNASNVILYYTLKNDKQDEIDLISYFKKNGIDILDINDKFFNDVCLSYSDSENDLTLNDRIKDIYKNYSFCEKNCKLIDIDFDEYKATCDCTIKDNMNVSDFNFDISNDLIEKRNNNFKIIKCYNGFTSIKDNLNNLGFWIFLGLMLLNILLLILYFCGLKNIKNYIGREMANHGYIGKSDERHAFCHNYIKQLDRLIERLKLMKNDFIKKKEPPKKKTKKKLSLNTKRKDLMTTKKPQSKNNKENLKKRIELLKGRMNNTKRVTKLSSTKEALIGQNKTGLEKYTKMEANNYAENNNFKLNIININVNEAKKKTYIPNLSEQILNIYNFNEAIIYDKRSFFTIYYIFLIAKQVIMHAFFYRSPLEPLSIRLSLLKFMLGCDLALNAIFYTDDKVSEKYNSAKSAIVFAFTNNLIVILLSTLIGYVMFIFLGNLNNSTNQIRNLFREEEEKIKNNKKYTVSFQRKKEIICEVKRIMRNYKIKVIIFYIIEFVCMIFFWYYVTIFCNIYKKTQLSWLLDCLITIIIRIIIDFLLNMILALLYKLSIGLKSNCLYRVMIFFYCFS